LGGYDPYSASKAAAEILIASYRNSFFRNHPVRIASARSGNVIGGGDYSLDRIIPDAFRALRRGRPIPVRNPRSFRPWQHVLEPTCGYLALAANLARSRKHEGAYNFGPSSRDERTVIELVREVLKNWNGTWRVLREKHPPHEARRLQLQNSKARRRLGWKPKLSFSQAIRLTMKWYQASTKSGFDAYGACRRQITEYQNMGGS
jgi:CDP-glucose 4,6-dehydratase